MTQTSNRLLDELERLMTDAVGATQGVRREVEAMMRSRAERLIEQMDLVHREDFEAMRQLAQTTREDLDTLTTRLAKIEAQLAALSVADATHSRG